VPANRAGDTRIAMVTATTRCTPTGFSLRLQPSVYRETGVCVRSFLGRDGKKIDVQLARIFRSSALVQVRRVVERHRTSRTFTVPGSGCATVATRLSSSAEQPLKSRHHLVHDGAWRSHSAPGARSLFTDRTETATPVATRPIDGRCELDVVIAAVDCRRC